MFMSKRLSSEEWKLICEEYQSLDCSQRAFCRERDLSPNQLSYHLNKLSSPKSFSLAQTVISGSSSTLELELPHGIILRIPTK